RTKGQFTRDDVLIAKRIAEHIALALSHHRLADESRRAAALEERAANLDALDGLLNTVAGVLDVRSVFDRISQIGNTVMPHDAMAIAIAADTPGFVRLHAATGVLRDVKVPSGIRIPNPKLLESGWEFELVDDMHKDERYASVPSAKAGMRSMLAMPIRTGGQRAAAVSFFHRSPGRF